MNKKRIVLALVAALGATAAFAQSNVTISGLVKAGVESYAVTGRAGETRVSDQSSRLIIGGTEDLGGGLKAWFQLDSRFATDIGVANGATGVGSGNTGIGLSSDALGKLTIGRWDLHYNAFAPIESDRAGSLQSSATSGIMSQVQGSAVAFTSRSNNVFMYDSPSFSGLTLRYAFSTNPGGNEGQNTNGSEASRGQASQFALNYVNGPLVAGYSRWSHRVEGTAATALNEKSDRVYAGYTFPFGVKVGLGWDRSKLDNYGGLSSNAPATAGTAGNNTVTRTAFLVPVSYEFGPHAVRLVYARAGSISGASSGVTTDNTGARFTKLGYDYAFSKRTSAGVYYTKLDNQENAAYKLFSTGVAAGATGSGALQPTAGNDAKQLYLGVAHTF